MNRFAEWLLNEVTIVLVLADLILGAALLWELATGRVAGDIGGWSMATTTANLDPGKYATVQVPNGWNRVWKGHVLPGDMYLNRMKALAGVIEWVRINFADIVAHDDIYDSVGWYSCVIRERDTELGGPCTRCGMEVPLEDYDLCSGCDAELEDAMAKDD